MPLREAAEYRKRSKLLLEWLNRRWLYNIPRSRRTEGIRPLGRLALVDHFDEVADRLRRELSEIMTPQAVADSRLALGCEEVAETPRVVIVGSLAGGVGGCLFDLGYAVRDVLAELGQTDDHLLGILAHSTPRRTDGREIATANTLSSLAELAYYSASENGYPGEPACHIQPRVDRCSPFAHTYVSLLGDQMDDAGYEQGCRQLAEYVFQSTASETAGVLERTRDSAYANESFDQIGIRSFGISTYGGADNQLVQDRSRAVVNQLLENWLAPAEDPKQTAEMKAAVDAIFGKLGVAAEPIAKLADEILQRTINEEVDVCFRRMIAQHRKSLENGCTLRANEERESMFDTIDQFTIEGEHLDSYSVGESLRRRIEQQLVPLAEKPNVSIDHWLSSLLDDQRFRIASVRLAMDEIHARAAEIDEQLRTQLDHASREAEMIRLGSAEVTRANASQGPTWDQDAAYLNYARKRTRQAVFAAATQFVRALTQTNTIREQRLNELTSGLRRLRRDEDQPSDQAPLQTPVASPADSMLRRQARELDQFLQTELFDRRAAFSKYLEATPQDWAALESTIEALAGRVAAAGLTESWAKQLLDEGNSDELRRQLSAAQPDLLHLGGDRRTLVIAPRTGDGLKRWEERVDQLIGHSPMVIEGGDCAITVCGESADTSLRNLFAWLVGSRAEFVKLADRLHVRIDIDWSPVLP